MTHRQISWDRSPKSWGGGLGSQEGPFFFKNWSGKSLFLTPRLPRLFPKIPFFPTRAFSLSELSHAERDEREDVEREGDKRGSKQGENTGKTARVSAFKGKGVFRRVQGSKGGTYKQGLAETKKNKFSCRALCHVQPFCALTARNFSVQRCEPMEPSCTRE